MADTNASRNRAGVDSGPNAMTPKTAGPISVAAAVKATTPVGADLPQVELSSLQVVDPQPGRSSCSFGDARRDPLLMPVVRRH